MKKITITDAALLAAGGGLMFLGGAHATRGPDHGEIHPLGVGATLAGAGLMVYAAWRIQPSVAAALGAVLLTAGYVNEHRREMGLPELPIPGLTLHWKES